MPNSRELGMGFRSEDERGTRLARSEGRIPFEVA